MTYQWMATQQQAPLAEVLTPDMTVAVTTCAACGDARPVGELRAYLRTPGLVLRCAACEAVQIRLVRAPGRAWLDLRGIRVLQVEPRAAD